MGWQSGPGSQLIPSLSVSFVPNAPRFGAGETEAGEERRFAQGDSVSRREQSCLSLGQLFLDKWERAHIAEEPSPHLLLTPHPHCTSSMATMRPPEPTSQLWEVGWAGVSPLLPPAKDCQPMRLNTPLGLGAWPERHLSLQSSS